MRVIKTLWPLFGGALASFGFQRSASQLVDIQDKPNEFRDLLAMPMQWAIQNAKRDYKQKVLGIQGSIISLINEETLEISADVHLKDETCTVQGKLDLVEAQLFDGLVRCSSQNKVLFVPASNPQNVHHLNLDKVFNVTRHFQLFWETYGASEAAVALDGGDYKIVQRYTVFAKNLVRAAWLNALDRGSGIYGITPFSDVTHDEFRQFYTMPKSTVRTYLDNHQVNSAGATPLPDDAPDAFDWRDEGAVTEVKNQGMCGSCWSFSTTGNVEGVHKVATGELISLSEQELVDCDKVDQGCNGGLMDNAFDAIEKLGGLEAEADYEYTGHAQEKCKFDKGKVAVTISGHHDVPAGDEKAMQAQLLETGPLAVALNAMWMQFYRGGVSHPWKMLCNPKGLDHGVLVVAYGTEPAHPDHLPRPKPAQDFWTIKNSWGPHWGESGYYRLFRGDGSCGIDQYVTTALP